MTKYFTMMAIRVACFVLMVVVTPYSWYTWLFAVGACFLPYVAVVVANVAAAGRDQLAQRDGRGVVVGGDEAQLTFPLGVARELPVRQEGAGDGERDGHGDVAGPPQRGATVHDASPLS